MKKHILVNPKWLLSCGYGHLENVPLRVLNVRTFPNRPDDTMYTVELPDNRHWTVWNKRGIQLVKWQATENDGIGTFEDFINSRRCMDWTAADAEPYQDLFDHLLAEPMGPQLVGFLFYGPERESLWIAMLSNGAFELILERDTFNLRDLATLEKRLFDWWKKEV